MGRRQKKCPSCGLTNFRDAAQCQWCALALQDRVRNELVDDRPAARGPWGAMLIMLAVAILCAGAVWHLTRKAVVRAEEVATEALGPDATSKPAKRPGPPTLSGRSPSDEQVNSDLLRGIERAVGQSRQLSREDYLSREEHAQKVLEEEKEREREEWARIMQQPPAAPAKRNKR